MTVFQNKYTHNIISFAYCMTDIKPLMYFKISPNILYKVCTPPQGTKLLFFFHKMTILATWHEFDFVRDFSEPKFLNNAEHGDFEDLRIELEIEGSKLTYFFIFS